MSGSRRFEVSECDGGSGDSNRKTRQGWIDLEDLRLMSVMVVAFHSDHDGLIKKWN